MASSFHLPSQVPRAHVTWVPNPVSLPVDTPRLSEDAEAVLPRGVHYHPARRPSDRLTLHQFFYVFLMHGLGAMMISGAINFAVAYAMYTTQDVGASPIRLYQLPNSLAGDAGLTILVQCIVTWMVELVFVNRDLKKGHVQPVGFVAKPLNGMLRWFMLVNGGNGNGGKGGKGGDGGEGGGRPWTYWITFPLGQVLRASIVAAFAFCLLAGPALGVLTVVGEKQGGGDRQFDKTWVPELFKLALGGALGLMTTPIFAMLWMIRYGWALRRDEAKAEHSRRGSEMSGSIVTDEKVYL